MAFSSSSHFVTSFLIELIISCYIFSSTSAARDLAQKTNNEFMKASCSATTYPKLCLTSLSRHSSAIQTIPKLMANTALSMTLASAKSTSIMMLKLSQSHGMKPREVGAMSDCMKELSDLVDAIQRSIAEMGNFRS
nr:pectin methylesterase inhibitor [Pyrus x bretschneideri]